MFTWINSHQPLLGPLLGVILTVLLIQYLLPFFRKSRKEADTKLTKFYNTAYVFVKIREGFSIDIDGKIHNKENCGFFHNFRFESQSENIIIYEESAFFNFVNDNFSFIDNELRDLFIEYFKVRGPKGAQNKIGCENSELIELRKQIEEKIIFYYNHYKSIVE